jgi:hypothetical protein
MRDIPVSDVRHPLADQIGDGWVVTESRAPVIFLNAARANLLSAATAAGSRVILVTDEMSALTPAFDEAWRSAGAAWVVRGPGGRLREGLTGRKLASIPEVFTAEPVRDVDDVDIDFLRPTVADAVEIIVTLSLRHQARETTRLGAPLAGLAPFVGAEQPELWSAYEPTGSAWDRDRMTAFARSQMPDQVLLVGTARNLVGTIGVRRTAVGVEEITDARFSVGAPTTLEFADLLSRLEDYLAGFATTAMPLVGLVLARPGRRDLLIPPVLQHPPSPLALLIGPPGVRSFDIDTGAMQRDFGARIVGRPRIPGLLFPLGNLGQDNWERLDAVLATLDPSKLDALLGTANQTVEGMRPGGRHAE